MYTLICCFFFIRLMTSEQRHTDVAFILYLIVCTPKRMRLCVETKQALSAINVLSDMQINTLLLWNLS